METISRRGLAKLGGGLALAAIAPRIAWAGQVGKGPDLSYVDPELRSSAMKIAEMSRSMTEPGDAMLPDLRKAAAQFLPPRLADVPVQERRVPVGKDQPDVTIFVMNARRDANRPAILHIHGGGFVAGQARYEVGNQQRLAKQLDCVVVSVEYRLAPETRHAGITADVYAALRWLHAEAPQLGVDRSRIAVLGNSAGGALAALVAIEARNRGEVPLAAQVLVYPALDDRTGTTVIPPAQIGSVGWGAPVNAYAWQSFLGAAPGSAAVPAAAVPARTQDLSRLPPTFIGVGGIDLLVGEDIDYARRLTDAGVPTELLVVPGAYHGFDQVATDTSPAKRFTKAKLNALRRAFGRPVEI